MSIAIVGCGLVSPAGLTSVENVFFLRANTPPLAASPFVLSNGDSFRAVFCPWIGARAPVADRLVRLAFAALYEALDPLAGAPELEQAPLQLCVSRPRQGLSEEDVAMLETRLSTRLPGSPTRRFTGDAGAFHAIAEARTLIEKGSPVVVVLAVDTLIALPALTEVAAHPPSYWRSEVPAPSEGGAALALMDARRAASSGREILGFIDGAATAPGTSTDFDDEPVDGVGMTNVLRALPGGAPIGGCYGQFCVDALRTKEWLYAVARNAERFVPDYEDGHIESRVGRMGAAGGLASLVYGLSVLRHGAAEGTRAEKEPFVAWAISPDGTRGAATARVNAG